MVVSDPGSDPAVVGQGLAKDTTIMAAARLTNHVGASLPARLASLDTSALAAAATPDASTIVVQGGSSQTEVRTTAIKTAAETRRIMWRERERR
jgi:hypothetical protein